MLQNNLVIPQIMLNTKKFNLRVHHLSNYEIEIKFHRENDQIIPIIVSIIFIMENYMDRKKDDDSRVCTEKELKFENDKLEKYYTYRHRDSHVRFKETGTFDPDVFNEYVSQIINCIDNIKFFGKKLDVVQYYKRNVGPLAKDDKLKLNETIKKYESSKRRWKNEMVNVLKEMFRV